MLDSARRTLLYANDILILSMNILTIFVTLSLVLVSAVPASAQANDWTPPTAPPGSASVAPPINTGPTPQIKRAGLGIDLSGGTLIDLPPSAAFFVKAASVFIEITGLGALGGWVPNANFAIDTNGPIRAHGIYSAADITITPFVGGSGEAAVCSDPVTGILKLC